MCTDWLETKTNEAGDVSVSEPMLYNAFCAWDEKICYSQRGAEGDQRGVQTTPGRVSPVLEHGVMQAGTTNNYLKGDICTWHLVGAS